MIFLDPDAPSWMTIPVVVPLTAGFLCFLFNRRIFAFALAAALVNLAAVCLLVRQILVFGPMRYHIGGWQPPLAITLRSDGPALLMLLTTSVTGLAITLYARGYFSFRIFGSTHRKHIHQQRYFWPLWMLLLAGLNGLFLSNDIFNLYVTLEVIGISAVALAALSGKSAAQLASFRYLMVSLLGSLTYLLGVVFLYRSHGVLDLDILRNISSANEPGMGAALALMSVGLLLKTALVPMHFWLPPAHANALAPVSVILSALVVKGSFYLLFRLWFEIFATTITTPALNCIGVLGAVAVLWGAVQAMHQHRLKLMIAYSTVSQLGYLFIAFPLTMATDSGQVWSIVILIVMAHACAKSAMFMAAGTVYLHLGHDRINDLNGVRAHLPITVFAYGIAGVSIMGLPPSGGFIAKWLLLTSAIASSRWLWALVIMAGSLLAMIYVFRVMSRFFVIPVDYSYEKREPGSHLLEWPALALALISLFLGLSASWPLHILFVGGNAVAQIFPGGLP